MHAHCLHAPRGIVLLMLLGLSAAAAAGPLVVGYYPSWSRAAYPHTAIPYQHLTHIMHAFLEPNADGTIGIPTGYLYPQLVQAAHQHGVKMLASAGGWGMDAGLRALAADTAARRRFVANLTQFCLTNGYDGADIDYEYPKNATERDQFTQLMHALRVAFDLQSPRLLLTIAAPGGGWSGQWFDCDALKDDLDFIGIMTYDYYGNWSSTSGPNSALYGRWSQNTQGWVDYAVSYDASTRGVPKQKLLIGTPFYGWIFQSAAMYGSSTGASQLPYSSIAPRLAQGWSRMWDDVGFVPYLWNAAQTQVISYDDSASVALKCGYIASSGVSGTIIWALGQDLIGQRQPLLETIGALLLGSAEASLQPRSTVPETSTLGQNYPNPFNGQTRFSYALAAGGHVHVALYDLLGREVRTLVDADQGPGQFDLPVNAAGLASGVYWYRLTTPHGSLTRSMILLR